MESWVETYYGARLLCGDVDVIERTIKKYGVWEPDVSRLIDQTLKHRDVFVDVGANIGYDALLGAFCVWPSGRVVAIEPVPATFARLVANLAENQLGSIVRSVQMAVSDHTGLVQLYELDASNTGATSTNPSRMMWPGGDRTKARAGTLMGAASCAPLADILTPEERRHTRLIKIDVEGGEGPIVWDLLDHLADWPKDMAILVEADPDLADWEALLTGYRQEGFKVYEVANSYDPGRYQDWRRPIPVRQLYETPREQTDLLLTRRM
jgi:FkbM family methyltransferase